LPIIKAKVEANHNLEGKSISIIVERPCRSDNLMDFCVHVVDVKSIFIFTSTIVMDLTKMFPRNFIYCMCLVKTWLSGSVLAFV
jgi:hypothetical protein